MMKLLKISSIPPGFDELVKESLNEGFKFLAKAKSSWESGANRFNKTGEVFYGAFDENKVVAVCGLNIDPYTNKSSVGRVRHLYVLPVYRRKGIAKLLVDKILEFGEESFEILRLRTDNPNASSFYINMGFSLVENEEFVTHRWSYSEGY